MLTGSSLASKVGRVGRGSLQNVATNPMRLRATQRESVTEQVCLKMVSGFLRYTNSNLKRGCGQYLGAMTDRLARLNDCCDNRR